MRAAIRSEAAAGAAIADTLQARAAQLQAFRNIKPAPVRAARPVRRGRFGRALAALGAALVLASCGGGDFDEPADDGRASIPARPASAAAT